MVRWCVGSSVCSGGRGGSLMCWVLFFSFKSSRRREDFCPRGAREPLGYKGGGGGGSLLTLGTNPTVMVLAPPCDSVRSSACASRPLASAGAAAAALRALPVPLLPPAGGGRSCEGAAVSASTIMLAGGGCCREAKVLDACSCGGKAGREGSTRPLSPPRGDQLVQITCSRARQADTSSSRALRSADSSASCAESISLESRVSARGKGA